MPLSEQPPELDLYAVLGVGPRAGHREIRDAWRVKVKAHHPDVSDGPRAEEQIRRINLAWDWLGDERRRQRYDLARLARADRARSGPIRADGTPVGPPPPDVAPRRPMRLARIGGLAVALGVALAVIVAWPRQPAAPGGVAAEPTTVVLATARPADATGTPPTPAGVPPGSPAPTAGESPTPATPATTLVPASAAPGSPAAGGATGPGASGSGEPAPSLSPPGSRGSADGQPARPLTMPPADVPAECRSQAATALRLDGDVDQDGMLDSIFFVGPCANLDGGQNAAERVLGPFIYASGQPEGGLVRWRLLEGAAPLAAGWAARSAFVGPIIAAPAGATDLGVELVAPDGMTSALAAYRIEAGRVRPIWDSLRDGHVWQDATFSYAPTPAGSAATDGARLLVEAGPLDRRVRQLWQWTTAGGPLELRLVDQAPLASPAP